MRSARHFLNFLHTDPITRWSQGHYVVVVIGLEIQEMSRLKTTKHPEIETRVSVILTIRCTEIIIIIIKKEKTCKLRLQWGKPHKKRSTLSGFVHQGKIVTPKLIQINLPRQVGLGLKLVTVCLSSFSINMKEGEMWWGCWLSTLCVCLHLSYFCLHSFFPPPQSSHQFLLHCNNLPPLQNRPKLCPTCFISFIHSRSWPTNPIKIPAVIGLP